MPGNVLQNTTVSCGKLNASRGQEPAADAKKALPRGAGPEDTGRKRSAKAGRTPVYNKAIPNREEEPNMTHLMDKLERGILIPYAGPATSFPEESGRQFRKRAANF